MRNLGCGLLWYFSKTDLGNALQQSCSLYPCHFLVAAILFSFVVDDTSEQVERDHGKQSVTRKASANVFSHSLDEMALDSN